jgi:hypothetical protein
MVSAIHSGICFHIEQKHQSFYVLMLMNNRDREYYHVRHCTEADRVLEEI